MLPLQRKLGTFTFLINVMILTISLQTFLKDGNYDTSNDLVNLKYKEKEIVIIITLAISLIWQYCSER